MDLTQPLSTLAPSLEADALTVLAGTESPLAGRRVAELARRGSHTSITRVLDRLVDHGLVHAQTAGRARLYQLNREHLLAPSVLLAVQAEAALRERLVHAVSQWHVCPVHVSIYGSVARGDAEASSDLDLLVIRRGDLTEQEGAAWDLQLAKLELDVSRWRETISPGSRPPLPTSIVPARRRRSRSSTRGSRTASRWLVRLWPSSCTKTQLRG